MPLSSRHKTIECIEDVRATIHFWKILLFNIFGFFSARKCVIGLQEIHFYYVHFLVTWAFLALLYIINCNTEEHCRLTSVRNNWNPIEEEISVGTSCP